ncbi:hypothetical protein Tco_0642014 [Tanacetum coccineum]
MEESLSEAMDLISKDLLQNSPSSWHRNPVASKSIFFHDMSKSSSPSRTIDQSDGGQSLVPKRRRILGHYLVGTRPSMTTKVETNTRDFARVRRSSRYSVLIDDSEQAYVDYASSHANEIGGNSMAPKSIAAISHDEREELRKKGIKSPSKLFSLKYLSPASIKELNKNPSAPKRVYFVNSIVILSKDSDTEEDVSSTNARRRLTSVKMMKGNKR